MALPITSLLAGLFALLMVPLSLQVSLRRVKVGADAGDLVLQRRIRAHGNFIEYVPTALVAVGLMEFGGASRGLVLCLATVFLASRILHALGMLYASTPALRGLAMLAQHAAFLVAGTWLVMNFGGAALGF